MHNKRFRDGCLTHWVFAAIIANVFPLLAAKIGGAGIFLFFAGMMVLQLVWVSFMMPETKGIALEDMESRVWGDEGMGKCNNMQMCK